MSELLRIDRISKRFGNFYANKDISLSVERGEIHTLLGENGAFGGETVYGTLQNGGLSAGAISDLVPEEIREKYNEYLQQMIDETFMAE